MKQDLLPFSQIMNTAIAQGAQMHKHISFIRADIHKPISFIGVEEFHHPLSQTRIPFSHYTRLLVLDVSRLLS